MFDVNGNVAKIDGSKGKYDDKVTNQSVKYGKNAVENFNTYMENPIINDNAAHDIDDIALENIEHVAEM